MILKQVNKQIIVVGLMVQEPWKHGIKMALIEGQAYIVLYYCLTFLSGRWSDSVEQDRSPVCGKNVSLGVIALKSKI